MLMLWVFCISGDKSGLCSNDCCRGEPGLLVKPVPPVEGLEAVDGAIFAFLQTPAPGAATQASKSLTLMAVDGSSSPSSRIFGD